MACRSSAVILGERATGSHLSLEPTCRRGWPQCSWVLALPAPQAKVGSGGRQPGQGSSGAGCTWGVLCRTRPQTSSRPVWGDISLEHKMQSPCAEQSLPACPLASAPCFPVMGDGRTESHQSGKGLLPLPSLASGPGWSLPPQGPRTSGNKFHRIFASNLGTILCLAKW